MTPRLAVWYAKREAASGRCRNVNHDIDVDVTGVQWFTGYIWLNGGITHEVQYMDPR